MGVGSGNGQARKREEQEAMEAFETREAIRKANREVGETIEAANVRRVRASQERVFRGWRKFKKDDALHNSEAPSSKVGDDTETDDKVMLGKGDQRQVVHTSRHRFPHPYCSVRVGGIEYDVPIPNRAGWSSNAPPRKGLDYRPPPRMNGETAELSKLMREEKITPKEEVQRKKEGAHGGSYSPHDNSSRSCFEGSLAEEERKPNGRVPTWDKGERVQATSESGKRPVEARLKGGSMRAKEKHSLHLLHSLPAS